MVHGSFLNIFCLYRPALANEDKASKGGLRIRWGRVESANAGGPNSRALAKDGDTVTPHTTILR
jgi:hypothetical protein